MPLFFVPLLGLMGIGVAMIRRLAQAPADAQPEDAATRLLGWATGLLPPERAEWGQAMLGELDHLDGRIPRLRFALGCASAALVLPPWGRAAAGVWALIALAVGGLGLYAAAVVRYGLGVGDWVGAAVLLVFLVGFLLAGSALVRRPGVAVPGLLGGLFVALAWLTLSGFTFDDQIAPDVVPWHPWVITLVLPITVGAVGTAYSRDPIVGKRVARLAGITAGLGLCLYGILAVAVIGAGGPPDDSGWSDEYIVSDRLSNTLIALLLLPMVTATVGWGAATAAGAMVRTRAGTGRADQGPDGATPHRPQGEPAARARDRRRSRRLLVLTAALAATSILAAAGWLRG